jgi:hypothetical protein
MKFRLKIIHQLTSDTLSLYTHVSYQHIIIIIIIIIQLQLGWHPVAVVYIYTQTVHRIQRTELT